ncbi:transcription antitermination factor NusB [Falsarthrobacter nasiphocae]|uniref:Transcription antitermination protein NusB n=1 Tax=Falsarthrobacter nasiphocae TaxID=189863 RepID=A0AAE3YHT7_9MICC|nr:transcription antitermination factor NusB [Falsarthrobacter nasiphocae]MDR6892982.1 N utilization substance protein B [Falsarthrobacter nasiphocae]
MSSFVTTRGKARRRAVDILFEADLRDIAVDEILRLRETATDQVLNPLTRRLVYGVVERREEIDEILATYAQGWTLDRMPNVDRAILRVGAWEILFGDPADVPATVAVKEATDIARELSTDDSPSFVNGLLGRIQKLSPSLGTDSSR